jgi:hypothetical protein
MESSTDVRPGAGTAWTESPHARDESVRANTAPVQLLKLTISDRTLSVVAIIFACLALGAIVMHAILYPQIVDAKIQAGAAAADATAREARTTAKVTDDKLTELRDHLNSKGMNIPKLDGH